MISDFWDEHPSVSYWMFTSVHTRGLIHICLGRLQSQHVGLLEQGQCQTEYVEQNKKTVQIE